MKASDELKELTQELISICRIGVQSENNYNVQAQSMAQAKAKGGLLLHKLGSFGAIWSQAVNFTATPDDYLHMMLGTAIEILDAITKSRLSTIEEKINAAVLGDLVEHAETLIEQNYFLAAAVVLRAVLEERLRKLCEAHALSISVSKPMMEDFKQALYKADIINKVVMKQIDSMAGVGNAAAHNKPEFNSGDVPTLYLMTLDFLAKFSP